MEQQPLTSARHWSDKTTWRFLSALRAIPTFPDAHCTQPSPHFISHPTSPSFSLPSKPRFPQEEQQQPPSRGFMESKAAWTSRHRTHPPANPTGAGKAGWEAGKDACKGASVSRAGFGSMEGTPETLFGAGNTSPLPGIFAVNASSSLRVKKSCGEHWWGFISSLKQRKCVFIPKPPHSERGYPTSTLGCPSQNRALPQPQELPLEEKQPPSCKTLHPCPVLAVTGWEEPTEPRLGHLWCISCSEHAGEGSGIHLWGKHNSAELLQHSRNTRWAPWECCSMGCTGPGASTESSHESF